MRIIDLLNKIANGEELPEIISYMGQRFKLRDNAFYNEVDGGFELRDYYSSKDLNNEVEVIEDNKKIEKIDIISDEATPNSYYILNEHGTKCYMTKHSKVIADKLNETIDKLIEVLNEKD